MPNKSCPKCTSMKTKKTERNPVNKSTNAYLAVTLSAINDVRANNQTIEFFTDI